jgi:DNA adenine methylase
VFIDPPYTVRHNANGFVKYNQRIFSWEDQVRLRDEVRSASDRGVFCLVTNANHQSILDLYAGIGEIFILSRNSVISGLASSRGYHTEIAITVGYKVREIGVPAAAISSSPRAGPGVVSPGPSNM